MLDRKLARGRGRSRPSRASHSRVVQARSLCDARGWRSGAMSWPSSGPREFPLKHLSVVVAVVHRLSLRRRRDTLPDVDDLASPLELAGQLAGDGSVEVD